MLNNQINADPVLIHVEPILAVRDVEASVIYWHDVLGFPYKWTWGEPPNHGGVSRDGVFIQFSLDPGLASSSEGNSIWIRVRNVEPLYEFHQNKNVNIVAPLEEKPWGMIQYTVRDLNGYYIHFAAPSTSKNQHPKTLASDIKILSRIPTGEEYRILSSAVGWGGKGDDESLRRILSAPIFALVAQDAATNTVIGCVLLLGDAVTFYYVKDLMVHPEWQHKGVGTMLMDGLSKWLDEHASENAFVGLYTGENLGSFYQGFGFTPVFGMNKRIQRKH